MSAMHRPVCPEGTAAAVLPCEVPGAEADRPWVLAATILASAMAFIDGTLVHLALPAIQRAMHATFADLQWVVHGYTLRCAPECHPCRHGCRPVHGGAEPVWPFPTRRLRFPAWSLTSREHAKPGCFHSVAALEPPVR